MIEIINTFNLCDICRIRNPKSKRFFFRHQPRLGFMQRRLDYIFISNSLQKSILNAEVLQALLSYYSSVLWQNKECTKWTRSFEIQQLVIKYETFEINLKDFIKNIKSKLNFSDSQLNWELMEYDILRILTTIKSIISYFKAIAKK